MSFRSATQATDSTRNGWMANRAAAKAAGQQSPVMRNSTRNSSTATAACSSTFMKMMAAGLYAITAVVQHVRKPGERMPVVGVAGREGPGQAVGRQPLGQVRILQDVRMVVEIDKSVSDGSTEDDSHGQEQKATNSQPNGPLPAEAAKRKLRLVEFHAFGSPYH